MRPILTTVMAIAGSAALAKATGALWTVDQVHRHAWELHGKVITVRGWLPRCQRLDCSLFNSKLDAEKFAEDTSAHPLLEIASDPVFNATVVGKLPAEIVLRAKVDATCIEPKSVKMNGQRVITVCGDRTHDLTPLKIIELKPVAQFTPRKP
jgi:hypothetical protein